MVHYSKVAQGLAAYIDREIVPKMFPHIAENGWVKLLGVVNGENVDVDTLITILTELVKRKPLTVNILGIPVKITEEDVAALHRHIMA